jgi:hypothetical protein
MWSSDAYRERRWWSWETSPESIAPDVASTPSYSSLHQKRTCAQASAGGIHVGRSSMSRCGRAWTAPGVSGAAAWGTGRVREASSNGSMSVFCMRSSSRDTSYPKRQGANGARTQATNHNALAPARSTAIKPRPAAFHVTR